MLALLLIAAAEIAVVQTAGDCATTPRTVRTEIGEPTAVDFQGLELELDGANASASLTCQLTLTLAPPPGFRAGVNGVHVRGHTFKETGDALDLTLRGGRPGVSSAGALSTLADGAFDLAVAGGTLWSGCGEVSPAYAVSLDVSGFRETAAASPARVRIDTISIGAIVYRRCAEPAQN